MDRNYCLLVFIVYICHPVIHRELQNVVYMKKKSMFKKKGGGSCPQVPVDLINQNHLLVHVFVSKDMTANNMQKLFYCFL